jgi:hypothetical protein
MNDAFYDRLLTLLIDAVPVGYRAAVTEAGAAPLYAFGLAVHGEASGVDIIASSEPALAQAVDSYAANAMYRRLSRAELTTMLRWSLGDWPLGDVAAVQRTLTEANAHLRSAWDPEAREWKSDEFAVADICSRVLRALDERGVFGAPRDVVLVCAMHDESEESFLSAIAELNSEQTTARVAAELEAGYSVVPG